jgi:hypothetical protein
MRGSSNAVTGTCKKKNAMPLQRTLSDSATQIFAVMLFFVLLGWPVLQISGTRGTLAVFIHVFTTWAMVIGLLVAISQAVSRSGSDSLDKRLDE